MVVVPPIGGTHGGVVIMWVLMCEGEAFKYIYYDVCYIIYVSHLINYTNMFLFINYKFNHWFQLCIIYFNHNGIFDHCSSNEITMFETMFSIILLL